MKKTALVGLMVVLSSVLPSTQAQTQSSPAAANYPFYDVTDQNALDYKAIQYLKDQKVVQGYPDGSFQPNSDITRAEFIKIVVGALGLELKDKECGFPDVNKDEWFAGFVCAGKKASLISGYPDGSFKPAEKIKFSESSKIVANAFKLSSKTDANIWYKGFVDALSAKKAIPLNVEFFDDNLTRSGMAQMIYRLKANVNSEASRNYSEINGEGFVKVDTCKELQDRLFNEQYDPTNGQDDRGASEGIPKDAQNATTTAGGSSSSGAGAPAPSYSETNLQVAGVDEADVVKTDGKYIYLLKNDTIRIVEAYPAENLKELVRLKLGGVNESFYPSEMYVKDNQLVLIGSYYNYEPAIAESEGVSSSFVPPYYNGNRTRVYILDITDKKSPSITRTVDFEANEYTSRKINNTLYLVLNQYIPTYPYPYPIPYYKQAPGYIPVPTTPLNPEEIMPTMRDSKKNSDEKIANCSDVAIFPKPRYANFLIVAGIALDNNNQDVSRKVLVANTSNVYVSQNNLFVTDTDWYGGIRPLARATDDIYNPDPVDTEKTAVYKFSMNNGAVDFVARGSVEGHVQNQFSMDEFNNNFRIATTKQEYTPDFKTSNNLFVLDSNMKTLGSITDIAPGETIYSTRFIGNRGYMVTFQQIDPLFIADLSDAKNPKLTGKLKVPGYSTYLHPYDENHIIGFGNEIDESTSAIKGLKMALFDVSDLKNPKEVAKEIIGQDGTSSDVLYNHKALLFDKEKNLLALPVTVYENGVQSTSCSNARYSSCPATCQKVCVPSNCTVKDGIQICTTDCDGQNSCMDPYVPSKATFQGAYIYGIDPVKGFQLKGKVTHFTAADIKAAGEYWYPDYYKSVQRILYIGDYLYTVSLSVIKANQLSDLSEKKMVLLGD